MVAKPRKSGGHQQGGIYETQHPQAAVTNNEERKVFTMANQIFMRVNEVAEELGVSVPYQQGGIYETQHPQAAVTNNEERKVFTMANQIFMRVNEVAEELGVSVP